MELLDEQRSHPHVRIRTWVYPPTDHATSEGTAMQARYAASQSICAEQPSLGRSPLVARATAPTRTSSCQCRRLWGSRQLVCGIAIRSASSISVQSSLEHRTRLYAVAATGLSLQDLIVGSDSTPSTVTDRHHLRPSPPGRFSSADPPLILRPFSALQPKWRQFPDNFQTTRKSLIWNGFRYIGPQEHNLG